MDATSMEGGVDAWHGLLSRSEVDQGIYLIEGSERPEEVIALAYGLEAATERFYRRLTDRAADPETKGSLGELAEDEVDHGERLWVKYQALMGEGIARETFVTKTVTETLENGKTADQVLTAYPRLFEDPREALELAMSLETDSLDLYLRLARKVSHRETSVLFYDLAEAEKAHLKKLGILLRKEVHTG